jgi:RHS repeat-associated protein
VLGLRAGWVENRDGAYRCARYYDPSIGRFISEDPIGLKGSGTNFYAYVKNDPINLTDPLGLCPNKTDCLLKAYGGNNGVALGVDVLGLGLGLLPGGSVAKEGIQQALGALVGSAGVVNGAMGAGQKGTSGKLALGGSLLGAIGVPVGVIAPGAGTVLSGIGIGLDITAIKMDYDKCMAGKE